jgi:hypothetical protein
MALVEKTKVYDQIYLKHGIKFAVIMAGIEKYSLRTDPDIVECIQAHNIKVQQIAKQQQAANLLTDEEVAGIQKECQSWGEVVNKANPD